MTGEYELLDSWVSTKTDFSLGTRVRQANRALLKKIQEKEEQGYERIGDIHFQQIPQHNQGMWYVTMRKPK